MQGKTPTMNTNTNYEYPALQGSPTHFDVLSLHKEDNLSTLHNGQINVSFI